MVPCGFDSLFAFLTVRCRLPDEGNNLASRSFLFLSKTCRWKIELHSSSVLFYLKATVPFTILQENVGKYKVNTIIMSNITFLALKLGEKLYQREEGKRHTGFREFAKRLNVRLFRGFLLFRNFASICKIYRIVIFDMHRKFSKFPSFLLMFLTDLSFFPSFLLSSLLLQ